jgi:hypothetical protein
MTLSFVGLNYIRPALSRKISHNRTEGGGMRIQRYDAEITKSPEYQKKDGAFVLYTDHLAAMEEKEREIERARQAVPQDYLLSAAQTIKTLREQIAKQGTVLNKQIAALQAQIDSDRGLQDKCVVLTAENSELKASICVPCGVSVCDVIIKHGAAERRIKELEAELKKNFNEAIDVIHDEGAKRIEAEARIKEMEAANEQLKLTLDSEGIR